MIYRYKKNGHNKKLVPVMVDTTLRDGEQSAGIAFDHNEKLLIAKHLIRAGIKEIEAGIPAMGGSELIAFKKIARYGKKRGVKVFAWCRGLLEDISKSIEIQAEALSVSLPVSNLHIEAKLDKSKDWILYQLKQVLSFSKANNTYLCIGAEDSSRADKDFLLKYFKIAAINGANRIRYCDTIGILDPFGTYRIISEIRSKVDLPLEVHLHNDFGMAVANAIAAMKAGATHISVTVDGLGERAGNVCLKSLLRTANHLSRPIPDISIKDIDDISHYLNKKRLYQRSYLQGPKYGLPY